MRIIATLLILISFTTCWAQHKLTVLDEEDSSPLGAATVFSNSGTILGITDKNGTLYIDSESSFPLTVRYLGYQPQTCGAEKSVVKMRHIEIPLQEVVVTPSDRQVMRLICYVREYISGVTDADTLLCFNEHMADFFLPLKDKIKGVTLPSGPRFLTSKMYTRQVHNGRDSIYMPNRRDDTFSWEGLVTIPGDTIEESPRIRNGFTTDSIRGKYGIRHLMRKNKRHGYTVQTDYLSDQKGHKISPFLLKLLGLTMEFNELQGTCVYRGDSGNYTPADIVSATFSLCVSGKGKWIKKLFSSKTPVQMYSFYELYPMDVEYLTLDDTKSLLDTPPAPSIHVSANASPLDPSIQHILETCKTIGK